MVEAILIALVAVVALLYISAAWRLWYYQPIFNKVPGISRITYLTVLALVAWVIVYMALVLAVQPFEAVPEWLVNTLNLSLVITLAAIPVGVHIALYRYRRPPRILTQEERAARRAWVTPISFLVGIGICFALAIAVFVFGLGR